MKDSSIIHHDSLAIVNEMSDELAGQFLKNLIILMRTGDIVTSDFSLRMALIPFDNQFKRDAKKYEKICERNRKNGELGGRKKENPVGPKKPSGLSGNPKNPDAPDNDSDSDNDNKKENAFTLFWNSYPVKKDKKKAKDIWKRKKLDNKSEIIVPDVINRKEKDRQWLEGFIPHPTTYLNGERWEDEIEESKSKVQPIRIDSAEETRKMLDRIKNGK